MAVANASSTASTGDDVGVSTTAMETHTIKSLSDIIAQSRIITVPIVSKLPIGSVPIPNSGPPALSSTFEARGRAAYGEDHHTYNASSNRKRPVSDAGAVVTQLRSPPSAMTIVRPHVTNSPPLRKLMKADVEFTNMAVVTEFSRITRPERQPVSEQSMSMRTGGDGSSTFNRLTLSQRHLSAAGSRSNRCINEKSKGLRHFSTKVCDKVRDKGRTTYNEVADELVSEYFKGLANTPMTQEQQLYDQKNIRRRVYDALNVLMAMNIISKERKEIKWIGLPSSVSQEVRKVEEEKKRRLQSIQQKMDQLQDLVVQQVAFKRLVERNRAKEAEKGKPSPEALLYLPFIIVTTDKKTVIDCNISNDRTEYLFTFDRPFEIHDDVEVLKRINNLSQTTVDLESIRQFLPSSVMRFADCAITECTALATFNGDTILLSRKIFRQVRLLCLDIACGTFNVQHLSDIFAKPQTSMVPFSILRQTSAARTCDVDSLRAIADNDVDGHFDSPARRKRHQPTAAISRSSPAQADREIRLRSAEQPDSERDWVLPNAAGDVLPSVSNAEAANLMTHKNKVPSQDMAEKQQSTPTTTAATFAPVALLTVATGLGKQLNVQKKIWS